MAAKFQHPPYRLFILGAGFSKPAGLPLSIELLEYVQREVRHYYRHFGDWDGILEEEIGEWKNLYPDEEVDLERVLAYSHRKHYLRLSGSDEFFEDGKPHYCCSEEIHPANPYRPYTCGYSRSVPRVLKPLDPIRHDFDIQLRHITRAVS